MKCLLFISLVFYTILLLKIKIKESFTNNLVYPDKPDDTQFYACHDYSFIGYGNTNYKIIKNKIEPPQHGPYSEFLDEFGFRNYQRFFHAPICGITDENDEENKFEFNTDISGFYRPIYDDSDKQFKDQFMELEEMYDKDGLKDPFYNYYNPKGIQNRITFTDELNAIFLDEHNNYKKDYKKFPQYTQEQDHEITCGDIDGHGNPHFCPNPKRFRPEMVSEKCTMYRSRSRYDGLDHTNDLEHCSDICCQE